MPWAERHERLKQSSFQANYGSETQLCIFLVFTSPIYSFSFSFRKMEAAWCLQYFLGVFKNLIS